MIRGSCPVCGRIFKVDDRHAGMTGKCKSCGADVMIPGEPDEGLDGLPPLPAQEPAQPVPQGPPTGAPEPPPEPEPAPEGPAISPRGFEPEHDARSHFEPDHGPTALGGHFLAHEPDEAQAEDAAPEPPSSADEALASRRIITSLDTVDAVTRPLVIKLACVVLGLLGLAFGGRFVWAAVQGAGAVGAGVAVVGIALAGIGLFRIWTGHWDGLIPAALFCILVLGGALLLASAGAGGGQGLLRDPFVIGLLAADGLAVLLLILTLALGQCREHFAL